MSDIKLSITLKQLEDLLWEQKKACANHMTRNLTVYGSGQDGVKLPEDMRERLKAEAEGSPYPSDFNVLSKYLPK